MPAYSNCGLVVCVLDQNEQEAVAMDNRVKTILLPVLAICGIRIRVRVLHGTFDSAGVIRILPDCLARFFLTLFWGFAKSQGRLRIVVCPDAIDALFERVAAAWQSVTRE